MKKPSKLTRSEPRPEQAPGALQNPTPPPVGPPDITENRVTRSSLQYIRNNALDRSAHTRRLIAELEEWSDEISATIAFLKVQQK